MTPFGRRTKEEGRGKKKKRKPTCKDPTLPYYDRTEDFGLKAGNAAEENQGGGKPYQKKRGRK